MGDGLDKMLGDAEEMVEDREEMVGGKWWTGQEGNDGRQEGNGKRHEGNDGRQEADGRGEEGNDGRQEDNDG